MDGSEEAYGRLADRGRFAVLHDVARQLVEQLQRDDVVTRRDGLQVAPDLRLQDVLEVVRLTRRATAPP